MPSVKKPTRKYRKHYLREWRKHRRLTQEKAAPKLHVDRTTLGRIENLKVPYSQGLLEAAAQLYNCEPWDLLNVNPRSEGQVVDVMDRFREANDDERQEVLDFWEFLKSKKKAS